MAGDDTQPDSAPAAARRADSLAPGTTIGRYRIERELGRGAMGVVFQAIDPELDRKVAIKLVRAGADLGHAERQRREAQALARSSHPNVVTVYDVGLDGEYVFIVMQLVDGTTLDRYLAGKPTAEILAAFVAAGRGLAAAHASSIVHRDFKPANVLVERDGTVRVSDFGLARAGARASKPSLADPALAATLTGSGLVGTPAYMAPEQFRGEDITPATDQFAFCIALWEALYDERPFAGATIAALADAVVAGTRHDPGTRPVPRRVRAALARGLSPRPADRFGSMTELVEQLAPRRQSRRYLIGAVIVAAIATVTIALSPGASDSCEELGGEISSRWNPFVRAVTASRLAGDPHVRDDLAAFEAFSARWPVLRVAACRQARDGDALGEARATCLDSALVRFAAAVARAPWSTERWGDTRPDLPSLDRCERDYPTRAPIVRPIGSRGVMLTRTFALAPDGRRFASGSGNKLSIVTETGAMTVVPIDLDNERVIRWSERGIWTLGADRYRIVDPATGAIVKSQPVPRGTAIVSPDGTRVVLDTGWWIVELATGARLQIAPPAETGYGSGVWSADGRRIAVVRVSYAGLTLRTWLRVIDVATLRWVDSPFRLDHGITEAVTIAWLDDRRIAVGGRVDPGHGEGLWIAEVSDDGRVATWEHRLDASPTTAYAVTGNAAAGRLIATTDISIIRISRIHGGREISLVDTIPASIRGGVTLTPGGQLLVTTSSGPGLVEIATGTFTPITVPGSGRVALDAAGRYLSIDRDRLYATTHSGSRLVTELSPGQKVRCNVSGDTCIAYTRGALRSEVRVLSGDRLGPPHVMEGEALFWDVAVSADGTRVAASGGVGFVVVLELATGGVTHWPVTKACEGAPTRSLAWSTDGSLYVRVACDQRERILRISPEHTVTPVFETDSIPGHFTVGADGDIYAVIERFESQPVLIDDL